MTLMKMKCHCFSFILFPQEWFLLLSEFHKRSALHLQSQLLNNTFVHYVSVILSYIIAEYGWVSIHINAMSHMEITQDEPNIYHEISL